MTASAKPRRSRPGGRSARVRAAVLNAAAELLDQGGYDLVDIPSVARQSGVHPTTIYRRWPTKAQLVGEALLERSATLSPTPDTGSLEGDLTSLLRDGAALVHTPAVRALFQVLLAGAGETPTELAAARDRFWAAHVVEARSIIDRAAARSELRPDIDPMALIELTVGPALFRLLLTGQSLGDREIGVIVARALAGLRAPDVASDPAAVARG